MKRGLEWPFKGLGKVLRGFEALRAPMLQGPSGPPRPLEPPQPSLKPPGASGRGLSLADLLQLGARTLSGPPGRRLNVGASFQGCVSWVWGIPIKGKINVRCICLGLYTSILHRLLPLSYPVRCKG